MEHIEVTAAGIAANSQNNFLKGQKSSAHPARKVQSGSTNSLPQNPVKAETDRRVPAQPARQTQPVKSVQPGNPAMDVEKQFLGHNIRAAMVDNNDPKESLKTIQNLLVGPAQRVTEARLDEILTILEEVDQTNERRITALSKQFSELSASVNPRIEKSAKELNGRIDELSRKMDKLLAAVRKDTDSKIDTLTKSTTAKLTQVSASTDAKLAGLTKRVSDNMNGTIRDLGRVITEAGKIDLQG